MSETNTDNKLVLRKACKKDRQLLYKWVNDPEVRKWSFRSEFILIEEHREWFLRKLNDPHCFQFIALNSHQLPVGQIRFEVKGDEAEVSVSVEKNHRDKGYGSTLIQCGIQALLKMVSIKAIHAFVKVENRSSTGAFQKAGFTNRGLKTIKGCRAVHLIWSHER